MAKVTLQTIAREVGVSRTTVSNAYSRPDQLTAELRQRILDAAQRLGYHGPNRAARMLRTGRIGTIGLVFTEDLRFVFSDPNTTLFMQGVATETTESSQGLTLLPVPRNVPLEVTAVLTAPVDGYVLFSTIGSHPVVRALTRSDLPVVVVDEPEPKSIDAASTVSFVGIDDRYGATLVGRHLAGLGHRRVGILSHTLDSSQRSGAVDVAELEHSPVRVVRERSAGYRIGFGEFDQLVGWTAGAVSVDAGRDAAFAMLTAHPELTALACMTDVTAIGATQAAEQLGRRVPEDLSVAGFDDIPRAATWEPALTTLHQPLRDKGVLAARMLGDLLDGAEPTNLTLDVELVVRASTGPAAD